MNFNRFYSICAFACVLATPMTFPVITSIKSFARACNGTTTYNYRHILFLNHAIVRAAQDNAVVSCVSHKPEIPVLVADWLTPRVRKAVDGNPWIQGTEAGNAFGFVDRLKKAGVSSAQHCEPRDGLYLANLIVRGLANGSSKKLVSEYREFIDRLQNSVPKELADSLERAKERETGILATLENNKSVDLGSTGREAFAIAAMNKLCSPDTKHQVLLAGYTQSGDVADLVQRFGGFTCVDHLNLDNAIATDKSAKALDNFDIVNYFCDREIYPKYMART